MRISDWSSDVCSSDLEAEPGRIEEDGDALLADDDARAKVAEERAQRCAIIGKCGQLAAAWRKGLIGYQAFAELRRQTKRIAEQFREALLHHRLEIGCRDPRAGLGLRGIMFGDIIAIAATALVALLGRHCSAQRSEERGVGKECVSQGKSGGWAEDLK